MVNVYIGVGGNLGNARETISTATETLKAYSEINFCKTSSFYSSVPLSGDSQPQYINAVWKIKTSFTPIALLDVLQKIEAQFGRVRSEERWASRTLDLDILLFGNEKIAHPRLSIPHPEMLLRDFVLIPLHEISCNLSIPGFGLISDAVNNCENRGLKKLSS